MYEEIKYIFDNKLYLIVQKLKKKSVEYFFNKIYNIKKAFSPI